MPQLRTDNAYSFTQNFMTYLYSAAYGLVVFRRDGSPICEHQENVHPLTKFAEEEKVKSNSLCNANLLSPNKNREECVF